MVSDLAVPAEESTAETETSSPVSRGRYVVLQSLIGMMLSYQLLFGAEPLVTAAISMLVVVGLAIMVGGLAFVPFSILEASWFSGLLVGIDTVLVTATIYLSGNARSDLYLCYFVLMLITASLRRFSHVMAFSLLLCLGYGFVLYQGIVQSGSMSAGQLLGVPVLLVMATIYGMAMQTIGVERRQKTCLLQSIEALRQTERTLQSSLAQLEVRIKGLKSDLSKANAHVQQGRLERLGLERQLMEAQKMEVIGRISSRIANEFSHLFSVIGKQTGLVLSHLKPNDSLYPPVDEIFRSGEQAAALTAQLAALDIQNKQFRDVLSIKTVVEELSSVIRGLLPDRIAYQLTIDPNTPYVEIDREGIEQVLLHVVVNARDAMPNAGRLTIEVGSGRQIKAGEPGIGSGQFSGSTAVILVSDTGSGMTRDTQSRMFEPFFSTKETNVGLGLTAVYGIVKQHGGHVEVISQSGQGTTVRISVPATTPPNTKDRSTVATLSARGEETVLVVEPHEIERKLAVSTLVRHHYRVLEAASPVEALMLVQHHTGGLHVAVSGLIMAEITGRDLARRLLKQYPTMKAVFVSGYDDEAILSHRINRRYLLRRPYRQRGLVEKVRELIDA
ncbi:MAG TPA: ATP-binding protein [Nitrospira sp.]